MSVRVAVVGDFDPGNETHVMTNAALDAGASCEWIPTDAREDGVEALLSPFAAL